MLNTFKLIDKNTKDLKVMFIIKTNLSHERVSEIVREEWKETFYTWDGLINRLIRADFGIEIMDTDEADEILF